MNWEDYLRYTGRDRNVWEEYLYSGRWNQDPHVSQHEYVRVKIQFIYQDIRVEQVVNMELNELEPIASRLEQMTPSARDHIKRLFEQDMAAWERRNAPRYSSEPRFDFGQWESDQQRRREEKIREENARRQEETRRKQEEARRERERAQAHRDWEKINEQFRKANEAFGNFGFDTSGGFQGERAKRARLAEIAGVDDWTGFEDKTLLRKAQRKAHPDTGGSHELWLEVDEIRRYLKL